MEARTETYEDGEESFTYTLDSVFGTWFTLNE